MKPFDVHLGSFVRRLHGLEMIIYHTFGVDNVKANLHLQTGLRSGLCSGYKS